MKYLHPGNGSWVDQNGSAMTNIILAYSAELNTFMHVNTDICSTSDATRESWVIAKGLADVIAKHIDHEEMTGNIAPQNRVAMMPAHLYQMEFAHIRQSLEMDMREERPVAYNYNLYTTHITKHY